MFISLLKKTRRHRKPLFLEIISNKSGWKRPNETFFIKEKGCEVHCSGAHWLHTVHGTTPLPLMVKHAYGRCPTRTQLSTQPLVTGHIWRRKHPQSPRKMGEGDYGRIPKGFCPLFDFGEEGQTIPWFFIFFHIFFTIGFWSATVQSFA